MAMASSRQCILPPNLLQRLAIEGDEETRLAALETLRHDARFRLERAEIAARGLGTAVERDLGPGAALAGEAQVTIYDQHHAETRAVGTVARIEGQKKVRDKAVNQAYDGLNATYDYYFAMFKRDSIDDKGQQLFGLVHYGKHYDNAFWDGEGHMFFGDGDGRILTQTTAGLDVIGHELTHGVTQHEANLTYSGQSGALNESISDVFGIQVKQRVLGQDVTTSNWLIGEDIVGPSLKPALRSMKDPGHANPYDDQPADMDGYVPNGDVHTNSGIPNRAFYLVATTLGGHSWDAAGPIWYAALLDDTLSPNATFQQFAKLTVKHARKIYGKTSNEKLACEAAWDAVKVRV